MINNNRIRIHSRLENACRGLFAAGLLLLGSAAQATPLNLLLDDFPDIFSGFIDVIYDSDIDLLSASGFAFVLDDDGSKPSEAISNNTNGSLFGTFDLQATINDTGELSGGTLDIGGTVAALGFDSDILLTGELTAFGFPVAGGNSLEFLFNVTGGDLAGLYGGTGGVIMSYSGYGDSFAADFNNNLGMPGWGMGVATVAPSSMASPIPVPAAAWLFGSGLLGMVWVGRRRRCD